MVDAFKVGGAMVNIVFSLAEVKINEVHRDNFFDLGIGLPLVEDFVDDFRAPVEHAVQVVQLGFILNLDDDHFVLAIFHQQVRSVVLVYRMGFIGLAFEKLEDSDVVFEKFGEKAFENGKIGLTAQQAFDGPVEADQLALFLTFLFARHGQNCRNG